MFNSSPGYNPDLLLSALSPLETGSAWEVSVRVFFQQQGLREALWSSMFDPADLAGGVPFGAMARSDTVSASGIIRGSLDSRTIGAPGSRGTLDEMIAAE